MAWLTLDAIASVSRIAWVSEMLGRGMVFRNLDAIVEEIRHYLEFEK